MCTARNVTGTVVDETNSPAAFVNVVLLQDSTFVDGRVTDDAGLFVFDEAAPEANNIKVSMVGYEDLVLPIPADGDCRVLQLKPSAVTLGEVVVKGNLPTTRIQGNAMVTNIENSILATTGSANDVLKNIPMVNGGAGNFTVFGRGNAVVYINGRLTRNADEIGQLSSDDIKEVQVISNPGAQYDADVKAVIRIITKKPQGEGFSVSASTDNVYNKWFTTT
ncbi:MAG: TonB-dependent receptor, partial [Muribaculaceae bacterium]|nr:TonB-dependent receptor [Muribaculaceae bacterium]